MTAYEPDTFDARGTTRELSETTPAHFTCAAQDGRRYAHPAAVGCNAAGVLLICGRRDCG